MQATPLARHEAKPNGVIDTLSAGYSAINRQLWVLLVPLVLDVFLWLGPQVSLSPMLQPLMLDGERALSQLESGARVAGSPPPTAFSDIRDSMMSDLDNSNVYSLIAHGPLAVPSIMALVGGSGTFTAVSGWLDGTALIGASVLAGLVLGGLFHGLLAQRVREGSSNPSTALSGLPRDLLRVAAMSLGLFGIGLLLGIPTMAALTVGTIASGVVAPLGLLVLGAALLVVSVHLFFATAAIFVSRIGPITAIQHSVRLVRRYFWQAVALIAVSWLILAGTASLWEAVVQSLQAPFGHLLAIVGNAYIASGLLAASMIFYKERSDAGPGSRVRGELLARP